MPEVADPSAAPPSEKPDPVSPTLEGKPRRLFIHLAVGGAVLFTLIAVGMLGWRWSHVDIPDMAIIVRGDADSKGTEIVVKNEDEHREIARGHLAADNNYEFIVMVERKRRNSIRATLGKTVLLESSIPMPDSGNVLIDLKVPPELKPHPPAPPPTKPSSPEPAT